MSGRGRGRVLLLTSVLLLSPAAAFPWQSAPQSRGAVGGRSVAASQVRALIAAGNIDGARAAAEALIASDPHSADGHYLLGLVAERQKDLNLAAQSFGEAISIAPGMAEAHDRLGFVLGERGRTTEALNEFARAVDLAPSLFDALYHLGATRWWTRDVSGA